VEKWIAHLRQAEATWGGGGGERAEPAVLADTRDPFAPPQPPLSSQQALWAAGAAGEGDECCDSAGDDSGDSEAECGGDGLDGTSSTNRARLQEQAAAARQLAQQLALAQSLKPAEGPQREGQCASGAGDGEFARRMAMATAESLLLRLTQRSQLSAVRSLLALLVQKVQILTPEERLRSRRRRSSSSSKGAGER
jgi:hypothetical protein